MIMNYLASGGLGTEFTVTIVLLTIGTVIMALAIVLVGPKDKK